MNPTYGTPKIGCYLDHANYNVDELNAKIIELAMSLGYALDIDARATMSRYRDRDDDSERSDGPDADLSEQLNWLADEAIDWLNDQETRSFLYWANEGEANAFGLWPNIDGAKEDVGFVSGRKGRTPSQNMDCPPDDYRGEWLHVNDHGNCTLYVRNEDGTDTEIWSVV